MISAAPSSHADDVPGGMIVHHLEAMFIDFDSFFASCEQQRNPSLRGRPVGVVPVKTDYTCCIAASYEAKAFGVRTGTMVRDARRLCPGIRFVHAEHRRYIEFQQRALEAIDRCAPIWGLHSIDELSIRLCSRTRVPAEAIELGQAIKRSLHEHAGECIRCSIGIAPNRLLGKLGSNLGKPNGLLVLDGTNLRERLFGREVSFLTGVGPSMTRRLNARGIGTVGRLYECSRKELRGIWEGVLGDLWWEQLRGGRDCYDRPTTRRTVGHQHVMEPALRTPEGARAVGVRLLSKACLRLRDMDYHATRIHMSVRFENGHRWAVEDDFEPTRDTLVLQRVLSRAWEPPLVSAPRKVSVTLLGLLPSRGVAASLFEPVRRGEQLSSALDRIVHRYGYDAIYLGSMHQARKAAPRRIAFSHVPDMSLPDAEI